MSSLLSVSMDLLRIKCLQEQFHNTGNNSASFHISTENEQYILLENIVVQVLRFIQNLFLELACFFHSFSEYIVFYYLVLNGC